MLGEHVQTTWSHSKGKQLVTEAPADSGFDDAYRFQHALIRDTAYEALLKRARANLHEQFVDWAEAFNRERGRDAEFEEILGYHLEQAHRYLGELGPLGEHGRALGERGRRSSARPAAARSSAATCRPPSTSSAAPSRSSRPRTSAAGR